SSSMEPTVSMGDRFFYHPISAKGKVKRGDLIVISPPFYKENSGFVNFTNNFLRVLSFQKLVISSWPRKNWEKPLMIKRVIAIPGDHIYMQDFILYVKPKGEEYFLSEFETSTMTYDIISSDSSLSTVAMEMGSIEEMVLNPGEYFMLGDNRLASWDSASWGILNQDRLMGKIFFRYWPFKRFDRI
ncbi:MAG: signal peptidase I, partial [Spirochaetaceae bacterium]|nr:signal peptidase I [Spirochaetaceae bacterium]